MENFVIAGLIFTIVGILVMMFGATTDSDKIVNGGVRISVIGVLVLIMSVILSTLLDVPQAIDVYRGNTTLEITYRDSVAVDSVVVWK